MLSPTKEIVFIVHQRLCFQKDFNFSCSCNKSTLKLSCKELSIQVTPIPSPSNMQNPHKGIAILSRTFKYPADTTGAQNEIHGSLTDSEYLFSRTFPNNGRFSAQPITLIGATAVRAKKIFYRWSVILLFT